MIPATFVVIYVTRTGINKPIFILWQGYWARKKFMDRRSFLTIAGASVAITGGLFCLPTDKQNLDKVDLKDNYYESIPMKDDERTILYLASLAPSGHNTQPWFIKYIEPYHWIIGNDSNKWLPGVDPTQRETILSIGAFLQNLEYAASTSGYSCLFTLLASTNQDENVMEVRLTRAVQLIRYDVQKIIQRRTVRSNHMGNVLRNEDITFLTKNEFDYIQYIPNTSKEHQWLNEQTIEATRLQVYRDDAEKELAEWIRFSKEDAKTHGDGLTVASMEIKGITAWFLRNFYGKADVMKTSFREKSIDTTRSQVAQSAGWLLITSSGNSISTLLETGKRLQRLLLKIRERNIAIHPMTQILEETATMQTLHSSLGIKDHIQFILRTGYLKTYPQPVSLRRPVDEFVRT